MPNSDELVDGISQINAERKAGNVNFTILEFTYAYGQVALSLKKPANNATLNEKEANQRNKLNQERVLWAYFIAGGVSEINRYLTRRIPSSKQFYRRHNPCFLGTKN